MCTLKNVKNRGSIKSSTLYHDFIHVCTLRAQTRLMGHFADCPQQCTLVHVIVRCALYSMPWEYSCTVRQSSGVSFNHFMSSLLLDTKCQEESLRADNSLPCLRVITAFTTQSNLPDLSFFCPTLITSLQGFYDHFLSYNSPLCFAGNSNEGKYLQASVVSNI